MTTKDQVLAYLLDSPDEEISGEKLARRIGVSRAAVWKAVDALRHDGHDIQAGSNRGYRLSGERDIVSEAGIRAALKTGRIGARLEVHPVIDSTNSRARALAQDGAPEGTVVIARGQTGGRGRLGRSFHSPADSGIYMSVILRPQVTAERAVLITALCAAAVAKAIENLSGASCGIKWVNDIFIGGKKACGILCEAEAELESGRLKWVVAGIGINVSRAEFPQELKDIATSIANETGREIPKNLLIAEICRQLETRLDGGGEFIDEYIGRSIAVGRRVTVACGDGTYEALVTGVTRDCALELSTAYGPRTLKSSEIRFIREETT